ncbi:hypothetical protein [Planctellipticum variicoloris]|uniref:hypothetical protein n=1 Tax=Planctellipticum variicoloris TaxID=3064265 RepID=UPI003014018E
MNADAIPAQDWIAPGMNKAFVREPDETVSRCPACEGPGVVVRTTTLDAWVPGELRRRFTDSACFCGDPDCDVVYFDDLGGSVTRPELQRPVPGKDLDAPLCACFGLTREDIDDDIAEGGVIRTRTAVQRANSPEARCGALSPCGQSCAPAVQAYYMKRANRE